jgi:hypothetical protein
LRTFCAAPAAPVMSFASSSKKREDVVLVVMA